MTIKLADHTHEVLSRFANCDQTTTASYAAGFLDALHISQGEEPAVILALRRLAWARQLDNSNAGLVLSALLDLLSTIGGAE